MACDAASLETRHLPGYGVLGALGGTTGHGGEVEGCGVRGEYGARGRVRVRVTRPHEHVVGQVARIRVCLVLRCGEDATERGDVLVVPRVAVGDRGAVGDARDLVAVVPPRLVRARVGVAVGVRVGVGARVRARARVTMTRASSGVFALSHRYASR